MRPDTDAEKMELNIAAGIVYNRLSPNGYFHVGLVVHGGEGPIFPGGFLNVVLKHEVDVALDLFRAYSRTDEDTIQ